MTHPLADKLRAYDAYEGHNGDAPFAMCFIDEQDRDAAADELDRLAKRESDLFDRLEMVEEFAEPFLDEIRARLTDDEITRFAYALCGITSEPFIRRDDPLAAKEADDAKT